MEASKCPKCGDEPHFVESVEKWYCYGCNSYIDDEETHDHPEPVADEPSPHVEEVIASESQVEKRETQTCKNCGAELEQIKDGKLYCYVCETYPENVKEEAKPEPVEEVKAEEHVDDAEALLASIPDPAPVIERVDSAVEFKPAVKTEVKTCSTCGQPMKWIDKYQRDYCYGCRKYAPKEGAEAKVPDSKPENGHKHCPECNGELKFIEKYKEYYCFACKKYPLRKSKNGDASAVTSDTCPKCGGQLKFIEKYQRQYCFSCKEYAPKGSGPSVPSETKSCPTCSSEMKYIHQYNEWYCYKCKKYSLRPAKPVLLF